MEAKGEPKSLIIESTDFLQRFKIELDRLPLDLKAGYTNDTLWTKVMLGTREGRAHKDYGPVGRIGQHFGLKIYPEWAHIDQVWYQNVGLDLPFYNLGMEGGAWINRVFVEHENASSDGIRRVRFNFFKLLGVISDFKILVSYLKTDIIANCVNELSEVLRRYSSDLPHVKYLVVLGNPDTTFEGNLWKAIELKPSGENRLTPFPS